MDTNWRLSTNRKKRFYLLSSTCFILIIIFAVISQHFITKNFKDATIFDMFSNSYRLDQRYVDTYVNAFHDLVRDTYYREGYTFEDDSECKTLAEKVEEIRNKEGIYTYQTGSQKYSLYYHLCYDTKSSKSLDVEANGIANEIYNNANAFTNSEPESYKLILSGEYNKPMGIYLDVMGVTPTLFLMGEDDGQQMEGVITTNNTRLTEYSYIEEDEPGYHTMDTSIELNEFEPKDQKNGDQNESFYYKVTDEEQQESVSMSILANFSSDSKVTNRSITGEENTITWQAVLNGVYSPCKTDLKYIPVLFLTNNRQMNHCLAGNSVYVERYRELYGDEKVYTNSKSMAFSNGLRYENGMIPMTGGKVSRELLTNVYSTSNIIGLFVDRDADYTKKNNLVYEMEWTVILVRHLYTAIGILFVLGLFCFFVEKGVYEKQRMKAGLKAFSLEWIPVELRFLLFYSLGIFCYLGSFQVTKQESLASYYIVASFISVILCLSMLLRGILHQKEFFANSLIGRIADRNATNRLRRLNYYNPQGIGYQLQRKTIVFYGVEIMAGIAIGGGILAYYFLPTVNHALHLQMTKQEMLLSVASWGALFMSVIIGELLFYLFFIRRYVKGIAGIQQQLELMGRGDFNTIVKLPDDFYGFKAEEHFEAIKKGVMASVENEMNSERMKIELVANVSHDIKTPLTSIINYVDLLADMEDLSPVASDYVKVVQRKSYRLKTMIQDLFDLSKASSGNLSVEFDKLDFTKLIQQTLADMDEQIDNSNLVFKTNLLEDVKIRSDGNRLYRVLQNLLTNALKYSMDNSRVYINLDIEQDDAVFTIKNMSRTELNFTKEEVMERFFRGDKSRSTEGSGLGVAIANSFTQACGGTFDIRIEADLFCIKLTFPVIERHEDRINILPQSSNEVR